MDAVPAGSDLRLAEQFTAEYLEYYGILPLGLTAERKLGVAHCRPVSEEVLQDLQITYGAEICLTEVDAPSLLDGIRRAFDAGESVVELVQDLTAEYDAGPESDPALSDVRMLANQPPVVRFVNLLIREAHESRASDIHLESTRSGLRVRLRIDGVLAELPGPPRALQLAVASRLKILAELDIAERRRPQDGRIRVRLEERELDLRVATVPTMHGESIVIRLLDHGGRPTCLTDLGMGESTHVDFSRLCRRPHGVVLVTGPTGSGKTTTLYAALGLRDAGGEKIITVEDPVEYHVNGVTQVPIHHGSGLGFGDALRSILRQDPDVLMVGEMRDRETAAIATQAAMTGHLVLSTLHTNDAVGAITRLRDLGIEPYMIAATLEGVLAQRLVRRICPGCREQYEPDPASVAMIASRPVADVRLERGAGCASCRRTGYHGRVGIFELLVMNDALRELLVLDPDLSRLQQAARQHGMIPLRQDAWQKVRAGLTTVEEVLRVTSE